MWKGILLEYALAAVAGTLAYHAPTLGGQVVFGVAAGELGGMGTVALLIRLIDGD